jgi:hypothetical protein
MKRVQRTQIFVEKVHKKRFQGAVHRNMKLSCGALHLENLWLILFYKYFAALPLKAAKYLYSLNFLSFNLFCETELQKSHFLMAIFFVFLIKICVV